MVFRKKFTGSKLVYPYNCISVGDAVVVKSDESNVASSFIGWTGHVRKVALLRCSRYYTKKEFEVKGANRGSSATSSAR